MSWQFDAAIRGKLKAEMAAEVKAGEGAVTAVIRRRTLKLKQDVRAQISSAGLGERLGNAMRDRFYPSRGASLSATGVVASRAIYKRPGGLVDLITVFQEGATINARGGKYLAIPVGVGKNESLRNFDSKDIDLIPFRNGQGYVVLRRGARQFGRGGGGVLFLLIKQARIKRRLNLDGVIAAAENGIDQDIVNEWNSRATRLGLAS